MKQPKPPRLIVVVSGGLVQEILSDRPVEIMLVDHDNIQQGDRPGRFPETVASEVVRANWPALLRGRLPTDL
jgi:hypothetical protein